MRRISVVLALVALAVAGCSSSSKKSSSPTTKATEPATTATTAPVTPASAHVFVINLENKGFDQTWGETSPARYLNDKLVPLGELFTQYYGVGHVSLDNYIAQISGQPPNPSTSADCTTYTEYANGNGCVYPASTKTVADQLAAAGKTWKSYQEDMGTPCRHPEIGKADPTVVARKGDMYATRHNPFVYFHSIIDTPACAQNVVDLKNLDADLASAATTPNLVYITPNLCHDGHDSPCVDGQPGGLTSADQFLSAVVPKILASPAFKQDGKLIVTFDESDLGDSSGCCGSAKGGGRVGALVIGNGVKPATVNDTAYNHYSLLCGLETTYGITEKLANAANAPCLPLSGQS